MKLNVTHASLRLALHDEFQAATLDEDQGHALEAIHSLVKTMTRADSATMGFAAGLYYGKHQEREKRRRGHQGPPPQGRKEQPRATIAAVIGWIDELEDLQRVSRLAKYLWRKNAPPVGAMQGGGQA